MVYSHIYIDVCICKHIYTAIKPLIYFDRYTCTHIENMRKHIHVYRYRDRDIKIERVEEEMAANYSDEEEDDIIHIGEI